MYEFRDKYQSVFRAYFDVVPFSKVEFYRLLCADACSLCARKLHNEVSKIVAMVRGPTPHPHNTGWCCYVLVSSPAGKSKDD